jgi:hypothetical protein
MRRLSDAVPAIVFLSYLLIAVLTYGHSLNEFSQRHPLESRAEKVVPLAMIISPVVAIAWPLYWSTRLFDRDAGSCAPSIARGEAP